MKTIKLYEWLTASNRWKHLLCGAVIGAVCLCLWDALVASGCTGGAMEWKDKSWHGVWNWSDFGCTLAGGIIGHGLHALVAVFLLNN